MWTDLIVAVLIFFCSFEQSINLKLEICHSVQWCTVMHSYLKMSDYCPMIWIVIPADSVIKMRTKCERTIFQLIDILYDVNNSFFLFQMLSYVNRIIADDVVVVNVVAAVVVVAKKLWGRRKQDELSQYFTNLFFITIINDH